MRTLSCRSLLCSLSLLAIAGRAFAGSGFQPGELILHTPALPTGPGIVRIDPSSGNITPLVTPTSVPSSPGDLAYDPFRDRVIFTAQFGALAPFKLWLCDGAGQLTDLGTTNGVLYAYAPASGGRIYMAGSVFGSRFQYLDAANVAHPLYDATGTAFFTPPHALIDSMLYDAATNSLLMATRTGDPWTCGSNLDVSVHRVRLSNDGSRAVAVDACVSVVVDPAGNNIPVALSRMPDGRVLIVVDTNSGGAFPRMQVIDPLTMSASGYASNDNFASPATNAGTFSTVLNKAVILDTGGNQLLAFGLGQTGMGAAVTAPNTVSAAGSSGETATLIEIPLATCSAAVGVYCTAKTTSSGCVPAIGAGGCPSATSSAGFVVSASQVESNKNGLFFYGTNGPLALPFQGGTLCVHAPTRRTPVTNSGGASACGGVLSIDFNAFAASSGDAQLVVGAVVHGQFWFRDPASASATGLSNAVVFTLAP